ncbi:sensor histidine kinase [Azospirillum sp.]|uniref:sensor histidine kinase n=1 Tax=Azospirillum sp. TaxID=34012 RepID=UPI003D73AD9E
MPLRTFRSHPSPLYRLPGTLLVMIACALSILLTAGLLGVFAWRDRDAAMDRATGVAANVSLLVAEHAARLIQIGDLTLRRAIELAGPPGAPLPVDRAAWGRLAEIAGAAPQVVSIWIGDAEGNAVLGSREYPAPRLSAADRDYFQAARTATGPVPFIGRIQASRDGTGELLVLSRPLPAEPGGFRGFVTVTLSPARFGEIYRAFDIGYRTIVTLERADGAVLAHESGGEGADDSPNDGEAITAKRAVEGYGLVAGVAIPLSSVRAEWRSRLGTYAAYGLGAELVVIGIGLLALQRARREREAEDALQHAYDTLEEHVRQRTGELEDANHRLEGALADKEILIKEVQHRVKNNLQVICSLLRLQAARLDERSRLAFDESLRRIQSMSLVHELLYRSNEPARINVADYLRQLCDSLARASGPTPVRVSVEAEGWILDVDRAMPLALIASELVSNALRHAFPDGHAGHVMVTLRPGTDGMRMEVHDDGVGLPADLPPAPTAGKRRGGLGLMLVQSLARQAHADLRIERGGGTRFILTIREAPAQAEAA